MDLRTWRRTMFAVGATLLVAGATLMVGGGLYAGQHLDAEAMRGIWVGSAGTLGVVTGVVLLKLALFGPVPKSMLAEAALQPEVDD
ncbi:MAG: hypothetical protein AABY18_00045 [Candidatus Thermoplasmatota archaeon]